MTTSEVLERAAELIEPDGAWTTGVFARDGDGNAVEPTDPAACCWCAVGSLYRVAPTKSLATAARADLRRSTTNVDTQRRWIGDWNDEHTQREVVEALRAAALAARQETP